MFKVVKLLIAIILLTYGVCAQQKSTAIDWDLTYKSVLERNNVAKTEWIWSWLAQYKTPAEKWVTGWNGKPIVASILIEHPAFHAAEHTTIWLIRTKDEAFYWETVKGNKRIGHEEPIPVQVFDSFYTEASSWKQLRPKTANEMRDGDLPSYIGFLSLYGPEGSRQMLLTMDDFSICLDKTCTPGKSLKQGRLIAALWPVLITEAERTYKHKSETEIAAMTPEQRIDEQIKEDDYHRPSMDGQSELIRKYRRMDGLKGYSQIIKLIESYNPKRLKNYGPSKALMMAMDIDNWTVRLRGTPEGRKIIDAIEHLSTRMKAAGEKYVAPDEMELPKLKGLNFVDHAIADTLWVKYRIKVSDSDLLEFSHFLVSQDPTYPSWSKREFIKDYSRINEAGSPAQVHIMKDPKRYHQMYRAFRELATGQNRER